MNAIELKNLGFRYQMSRQPTIKNINLEVKKGEFIGIVGPNGSGKTTLCNIIRRIIPNYTSGELRGDVIIDGKNVNDYSTGELAEKIGLVFQNPFIQISGIKKTVFEEIAFGLENLGVPRDEMIVRTENILKQFEIEYLKDQHPSKLSGGQSQRVALASVLVMEPDILIVDEPTSQLDPKGTEEVFDALGILKEQNKTVVLVEHKIDLISEYADRVLVMADQGIKMEGPTSEILSNPQIEEFGIPLPQIAKLSHEVNNKYNLNFEEIPTTVNRAEEIFRRVVK